MKKTRRLLSLALAAALMGSMLPLPKALAAANTQYVSTTGDDADGNGSQSAPYATIQRAYERSGDGDSIILMDDLELTDKLELAEDKEITIAGSGDVSVTYVGSDTIPNTSDAMIAVRAGSVTFEGVTLQLPEDMGTNGRVLYVGPEASATLNDGAVVTHGYLAYDGGGVQVDGGSLTMLDGSAVRDNYIANNTDCYGGGVSVIGGGTFRMEGGVIEGNTIHTTGGYGSYGGGVAVDADSTFIFSGGSIQGNQVDTAGGGVYLAPGGSALLSGSLIVEGNSAGGEASNLFLPDEAAFSMTGTVNGKVGVTCETPDYSLTVGTPQGYDIQPLDEGAFSYDDGQFDIRLKGGDLVLYWFTVPVTLRLDGVDSENETDETPVGQDYDTTLTAQEGYLLPKDITVTVGGAELDQGSFTYDQESGALHIPGDQVAGSISVSVAGDAIRSVVVTTNHVNADLDSIDVIRDDTVIIQLTAADRYALPDQAGITITGQCRHTYKDGVLTLTDFLSDVKVHLEGAEIYHTIYFDAGEGECDPASLVIPESQRTYGPLPVPFLVGYSFEGWFSGDVKVDADTVNQLSDDLHLTARWVQKTNINYQIQHWMEYVDTGLNPGYTGGQLQTMTHDGESRLYYLYSTDSKADGVSNGRLNLAERTLSKMTGELSLAGITTSGANEYSVIVAPDGSSVYPLFYDRTRYTLHYDANGGSLNAAQASATVVYGSQYAVMPAATRPGYTLLGWYTEPRGGNQVKPGDVCKVAMDQTLYAHWSPVGDTPYTVYHMAQALKDNTVSGDKIPENYTVAHIDTLHGTSDTTVDLYAIAMEGFLPCRDNDYSLTIRSDGTAVAYLYYDRKMTDVAFDSMGGDAVDMTMCLYYGGTFAFLPAAPSRTGYTFTGWYTGKEAIDQRVAQGTSINSINPEGNTQMTLYAHWSPRTYPLTFETHGGTLSQPKTVTYDQRVGELPTAELTGYIFKGWYDADGKLGIPEGNRVTEDTMVTLGSLITLQGTVETPKTLYAWYEPVQVSLTFDPAPGQLPEGGNVLTLTYDKPYQHAGALPVPTLTGYSLRAWHLNSLTGTILDGEALCKLIEDVTAYAEYVPNVYVVTLDAQGGSADVSTLLATFDEPYGTLPTPTRRGYTFLGWFNAEGEQITGDMTMRTANALTLTARWQAVTSTVTFDVNEGQPLADADKSRTVTFDQPYGVMPEPTRSGYVFQGWYTEKEAGIKVEPDTAVTELADHTLYAHWRVRRTGGGGGGGSSAPTEYTLTFETNGGDPLTPISAVRSTKVDLDKYQPTRKGYTFQGWFADKELTQAAGHDLTIQKNTTLYAKWEKEDNSLMSMLEREKHIAYILGFPNGTVRPTTEISRAEVAQMFFRLLNEQAKERYTTQKNSFLDVRPGEWYNEAVSTLAAMGIVKGRSNIRFAPDAPITRAEFAVIAARFSNASYDGPDLFDDIQGSWARLWINRAAHLGWVQGNGSGSFLPQNHMTRAEAAVVINRALGRLPESPDDLLPGMRTFPDNNDTSSWYYLAIQEAANAHTYERRQDHEAWTALVK